MQNKVFNLRLCINITFLERFLITSLWYFVCLISLKEFSYSYILFLLFNLILKNCDRSLLRISACNKHFKWTERYRLSPLSQLPAVSFSGLHGVLPVIHLGTQWTISSEVNWTDSPSSLSCIRGSETNIEVFGKWKKKKNTQPLEALKDMNVLMFCRSCDPAKTQIGKSDL